ncbi:LysE family translocator [Stappia taiwanensis]|uniref:LysE family translocator n=1 Tax=Stappia taiwanensis TaxID=992267 RepID=A0A838XP03_9HYPH|nr:LysE family translocator [Stappia taiwanensis]MBA4612989.1 LysE family translocator [Stappia taiwanensis]GGF02097.1 lysine transporter LysE [Stappia taiwanensis]
MGLEFLITALVVVLIPGTGVLYTLATGLAFGQRHGIAAAFGCTLGILPAILASVLGLAALLHTSALLFQALKYAGAAYLLYLAWQTLRETGPLRLGAAAGAAPGLAAVVRTGALINVLNPKLSVFFLAFLPQFVDTGRAGMTLEMLRLGGVFMALTLVVFTGYGIFAAAVGARLSRSAWLLAFMRRTVAVAFAGFGLRLALADR